MKVIYYSYPFFADCDFPLVKALQDKGVDMCYYMPLARNFKSSSIIELKKPLRKLGIIKASQIKDFEVYKECIDLERLFIISGFRGNYFWIPSWILWIYTLYHMKKQKADVIHVDWQFGSIFEKLIFKFTLGKKKVVTVHDPIMHSGQPNAIVEEKKRRRTFKWGNHFMLLNKVQTKFFQETYHISSDKISFSVLPNYDSISKITPISPNIQGDFILFFGSIKPYKGVEYLLDAMMKIHKTCPNLKLVIAGNGDLYFDVSKYHDLDYIIWMYRYISISELAGLLKACKFVVCPYKDATQSGVVQTSFSMKVPVVASNVGSLSADIENGVNGLLVPRCDVSALSEAIKSLYLNEIKLKEFKNNIISQQAFNNRNERIAIDYIRMYNQIVGE